MSDERTPGQKLRDYVRGIQTHVPTKDALRGSNYRFDGGGLYQQFSDDLAVWEEAAERLKCWSEAEQQEARDLWRRLPELNAIEYTRLQLLLNPPLARPEQCTQPQSCGQS